MTNVEFRLFLAEVTFVFLLFFFFFLLSTVDDDDIFGLVPVSNSDKKALRNHFNMSKFKISLIRIEVSLEETTAKGCGRTMWFDAINLG